MELMLPEIVIIILGGCGSFLAYLAAY